MFPTLADDVFEGRAIELTFSYSHAAIAGAITRRAAASKKRRQQDQLFASLAVGRGVALTRPACVSAAATC
jgi:uncharacterized metal-binding protein